MLLLSKQDIKQVFSMKAAIEADKEAFSLYSSGQSDVPLRTQILVPAHDGTFLFMPAYAETVKSASLKIVNIFPHNSTCGLPTAPAQVLLIDGETGIIIGLLDGTYVTQLRTGAASGAAFDVLAPQVCHKGALIGTGGQAATQLEGMLTARNLDTVKVFDLDANRLQDFVKKMQYELASYETNIEAAHSSDEAIEDADLIITVTPSRKPVFDGLKVKAGATISCVGAYQPHMQEMDPAILPRADKIYFDSQSAVLAESGDILIPLSEGLITKDDFTGELGNVLLGNIPGRESDDEIIVFETVGIGTQDLLVAKRIYDKAKSMHIGTEWG